MQQNIYLKLRLQLENSKICLNDILYVVLNLMKYLKENLELNNEYIEKIYNFSINFDNYIIFEDDLLEYVKAIAKELDLCEDYYNEIMEFFEIDIENEQLDDYFEDNEGDIDSEEISFATVNSYDLSEQYKEQEGYIISYEVFKFLYNNIWKPLLMDIKRTMQGDKLTGNVKLNTNDITYFALYQNDIRFSLKSKQDMVRQFLNDIAFWKHYNDLNFDVTSVIEDTRTDVLVEIFY